MSVKLNNNSQSNWEIVEIISTPHAERWKTLQFSFAAHEFLYLYKHIPFSKNKSIFYFKGSVDSFDKINVIVPWFNIVNFQMN